MNKKDDIYLEYQLRSSSFARNVESSPRESIELRLTVLGGSITREVLKTLLFTFVYANLLRQEKSQQKMISEEEHTLVQRSALCGVQRRILNQSGQDESFYTFETGSWAVKVNGYMTKKGKKKGFPTKK